MTTSNNEPKLTKDLYHRMLKHIDENKGNASDTLILHVYLSVLYFIDVDGELPTLLGLTEQFEKVGMSIPDELKILTAA